MEDKNRVDLCYKTAAPVDFCLLFLGKPSDRSLVFESKFFLKIYRLVHECDLLNVFSDLARLTG